MTEKLPAWVPVAIELEGRDYTGSWFVENDVLTVDYQQQRRSMRAPGADEKLARLLLEELVVEAAEGP